jgi:hypothetical protein
MIPISVRGRAFRFSRVLENLVGDKWWLVWGRSESPIRKTERISKRVLTCPEYIE